MLSILGLVAIFIVTYFVYKSAKDYGRNAIGWSVLTFCLGFGIQLIIPIMIGIIMAVYMSAKGNSITQIQEYLESISMLIGILCLILSIAVIGLIMRFVGKMPEESSFIPPPKPPKFD